MSKHRYTREPWKVEVDKNDGISEAKLYGPDGYFITPSLYSSRDEVTNIANARRIVACVNALAGLDPEAVADVPRWFEEIARIATSEIPDNAPAATPLLLLKEIAKTAHYAIHQLEAKDE